MARPIYSFFFSIFLIFLDFRMRFIEEVVKFEKFFGKLERYGNLL
jgi:hypothetical protein